MSDLQTMMIALRESMTVPTKRESGLILAEGGWAVFPLPNYAKFDEGLSYLNATMDPAQWADMCDWQLRRHEGQDVNIALAPGKCAVPLIVVDLDGSEAIHRFFDDAMAHGHIDVSMWLRANTTRVDYGRHIYFAAPEGKQWSNSTHVWGGDVRSGRGHVVMPPSTTETGRYTWAGEKLYTAPEWVIAGLRGNAVGDASRAAEKSQKETGELLERLSQWNATSYGRVALTNMLDEMSQARAGDQRGGRNPHLSKTINRVMDLAINRDLNALEAISEVAEMYESLFSPDENRNPLAEVVRCVNSWIRNHEKASEDVDASSVEMQWAMQRGGGAVVDLPDVNADMLTDEMETRAATTSGPKRPRRRTAHNWRQDTNK